MVLLVLVILFWFVVEGGGSFFFFGCVEKKVEWREDDWYNMERKKK